MKPRKTSRPKSDNSPEQHAAFERHMRLTSTLDENRAQYDHVTPSPSIMRACREARRRVGAMTPVQKRALEQHARNLIAEGSFDVVLANQLKALGCTFNVAHSFRLNGTLLHVGPPDTFWTTARRLLTTVRSFYPRATFAPTDAEGCISFALEGVS